MRSFCPFTRYTPMVVTGSVAYTYPVRIPMDSARAMASAWPTDCGDYPGPARPTCGVPE